MQFSCLLPGHSIVEPACSNRLSRQCYPALLYALFPVCQILFVYQGMRDIYSADVHRSAYDKGLEKSPGQAGKEYDCFPAGLMLQEEEGVFQKHIQKNVLLRPLLINHPVC
jgi:hypothetical protein